MPARTGLTRAAACLGVLLLTAWLAVGCSSGPDMGTQEPEQNGVGSPHGIAGLPAPSVIAAVIPPPDVGRFLTGTDTDFALPLQSYQFISHGIELRPAWDGVTYTNPAGLAYAGFSFSVAGLEGPPEIQLGWYKPPVPGSVWLALADWERNRWEWHQVPDDSHLEFASLDPYLTVGGKLSTVVLATGTVFSELSWLRVGGNLNPLADISGTAPIAVTSQPCTLNGGASLDPDGQIALYEWDTDGDGNYDLNAGEASQIDYTYTTPGSRTVTLRVTDDKGATDVESKELQVGDGVYDFAGFESGWQGWAGDVADVLVSLGDEIYWELDRSDELPYSGDYSVWLTADNRTDACKLWVEKRFELAPHTSYTASISYKFASEVGGEVGTWTVIAGAMPVDPETGYDIFLAGLPRETTYNGGVPGFTWLNKSYTMDVTTDASGELYMLAGVWGVFEVWQTYYIDDITVQIVPLE